MRSRAESLQSTATVASPIPAARDMPRRRDMPGAVADEMAAVNKRLFLNPYFQAVDAAITLGSFRVAGLLEWWPWLLPLLAACTIDGGLRRIVKSKEFVQHDPEVFALACSLAILTVGALVLLCVVPIGVHALALGGAMGWLAVLAGWAVGSFHRRG